MSEKDSSLGDLDISHLDDDMDDDLNEASNEYGIDESVDTDAGGAPKRAESKLIPYALGVGGVAVILAVGYMYWPMMAKMAGLSDQPVASQMAAVPDLQSNTPSLQQGTQAPGSNLNPVGNSNQSLSSIEAKMMARAMGTPQPEVQSPAPQPEVHRPIQPIQPAAPGAALSPEPDVTISDPVAIPAHSDYASSSELNSAMISIQNEIRGLSSKVSRSGTTYNDARVRADIKSLKSKIDILNKKIDIALSQISRVSTPARTHRYSPPKAKAKAKPSVRTGVDYFVLAAVSGTAWIHKARKVNGKWKPVGEVVKISEGDTLKVYGKIKSIHANGEISTSGGIVRTKRMM